jgi:hypothetical protein
MNCTTLAAAALLAFGLSAPANGIEIIYTAPLASEVPGASPGTGDTQVIVDFDAISMRVQATFSGLLAPTTVAHIHCCTAEPFSGAAGVATQLPTFEDFPAGVLSGTYDHTFDMTQVSSYNTGFVEAQGGVDEAFDALVSAFEAGTAYLNIHTSAFPGGEIRGFLQPIPEPQTWALLTAGLAVVGWRTGRRRAH